MNNIDWKQVANAIRENRFEDITSEVWSHVADKLESLAPKKKGAKAYPKTEQWNSEEPFKQFNEWFEKKRRSNIVTAMDRYQEIESLYEVLLDQGMLSGIAEEQIAKDLTLSVKSVQRVLTAIRANRKANNE